MHSGRRVLLVLLIAIVIGCSLLRFCETTRPLADQLPSAIDGCTSTLCRLVVHFHIAVGYLSLPLGLSSAALLARSHPASFLFTAGFLVVVSLADLSAIAVLWRHLAFSEALFGPNRDELLLVRLLAPPLGVIIAVVLRSRSVAWRAA